MGKESGHFGSAALDDLHKCVDETGHGSSACLTGHMFDYREKRNEKSCNYRYQCYKSNSSNGAIRSRLERYKELQADQRIDPYRTDATKRPKLTDWFRQYAFSVPAPKDGDWDIGGPTQAITRRSFYDEPVIIKEKMNFTTALWPYFNNAHHIISKGTLKGEINATGAVSELIQQALLKAFYNVNDGLNMIFLPMDKRIGQVLHLPRHLEVRAAMSHRTYDSFIKAAVSSAGEAKYRISRDKGLREIIQDFKRFADKAKKKVEGSHGEPNLKLGRAKLEDLSRKLLKHILDWGAAGGGESLDKQATS